MKKRMNAKQFGLDFLATVFGILMSVFCFFYFIIGSRMGLAEDIARIAAYGSVLGLFFLFEFKSSKKEMKRKIERNSLDDILVYFDDLDKFKNLCAVIAASLLVFLIPLINLAADTADKIQVIFVIVTGYLWHIYIFRTRDSCAKLAYATYYDQVLDKIFVFVSSFAVISIALSFGVLDEFDMAQALSVFLIYYFWHKRLIREK